MKKDTFTLKDAFTEAVNNEAQELSSTDAFPSSIKLVKRINSLFNKEDSPFIILSSRFARKVALAVICIFTASALSVGTGAAIIHFGGFNTNIHDKGTDLYISVEQQETLKDSIEEYYTLEAIPDDYELNAIEQISPRKINLRWVNQDGNYISFFQSAGKTQSWTLNTEKDPYEQIIFNGNEAIYYEWEDIRSIKWIEDGYLFSIVAKNLSFEEIISLAESLTKE